MKANKEELKNKIIYRASYRGSKEMDILMSNFVKSLIDELDLSGLKELNILVNKDDEFLLNLKKNLTNKKIILTDIVKKFQKF